MTFVKFTVSIAVVLCFLNSKSVVQADYGDYVDPTFNCPAMSTCQQVCVARATDCPLTMLCSGNDTLCVDGSCAPRCTGNEISPCEFDCAPVACHKIIDNVDSCNILYGGYLEAEAACGEEETAVETSLWNYNEAGFICFYAWIGGATTLLLGWCAFNQRIAPVEGSTQPLELSFSKSAELSSEGYQTGYRLHPVGMLVNFVTGVTLAGIQGLLAYLTVQYYIQQELFTGIDGIFDDEVQVLTVFEITWSKSFDTFRKDY